MKNEDHIDELYKDLGMFKVWFDDVACRNFLYTLE